MRNNTRFIQAALSLVAIAFLCGSCSSGDPEIRASNVRVVRVQDLSGAFAERLSVFVLLEDSDGSADFGSIVVTHDDSGLFWTITPDRSEIMLRGKDRWTGSSLLTGPGDGPIPEGAYSLAVSDLAGNEDVTTFTLSALDLSAESPYRFEVSAGQWKLERQADAGNFRNVWFLLYDRDSKLLNTWKVPDSGKKTLTGSVKTFLAIAQNAVFIQCYAESVSGMAGVLLTPLTLQ